MLLYDRVGASSTIMQKFGDNGTPQLTDLLGDGGKRDPQGLLRMSSLLTVREPHLQIDTKPRIPAFAPMLPCSHVAYSVSTV